MYLQNKYNNTKNLNYLFAYYRNLFSKEIKNSTILTIIFYNYFITKEKLKKLKINISKIANYHELYLVLQKKHVVSQYYNNIAPSMIQNYKTISKYCNKILLLNNKIINNHFKDFNKINILKLIDKYGINKTDKKYIKDNLIKLAKKYHLPI